MPDCGNGDFPTKHGNIGLTACPWQVNPVTCLDVMFGRFKINRRAFLSGLGVSAIASPSRGSAPVSSPLPLPRPPEIRARRHKALDVLASEAGISGKVSCAVADARTGEILESLRPVLAQPPASVTKAITALYALETLGSKHRFRTRILATGPVKNGIVQGDIALVGGNDPVLNTDDLFSLASALKGAGIRGATGRFVLHGGGLPLIEQIDPDQPAHVGYNPAVSGLVLNFNRVYFEWKRGAEGYTTTMDARSDRLRPRVSMAKIKIVDRKAPTYTYARKGGRDQWTVARAALGKGGGRWLPVRDPIAYAGEVFASLARSHGIELKPPRIETGRPPEGAVLAEHTSPELSVLLRGMLKYSTNITAEVLGLAATRARGVPATSLRASANEMSRWLADRLHTKHARFVDHSGLSDASRISAHDMVRALVNAGAEGPLAGLLKVIPVRDEAGKVIKGHPLRISAKTGTLNFVSALAGYVRAPDGRQLTFAIFSADTARRAALSKAQRERPDGGRTWTKRARRLQHRMLKRWADIFGVA